MTDAHPETHPHATTGDRASETSASPRRWSLLAVIAAVAVPSIAIGVVATIVLSGDDHDGWQHADVGEQGAIDESMADRGARLQRRPDGLTVELDMPTPAPGSYDYPTADMVPPGAASHPPISQGAGEAPEVFTLWVFVFNDPGKCTDGQCDTDDFQPEAAARGGVYQADGRVGVGDDLSMAGTVRLGHDPIDGAPLDNPDGAEVHIAIAPHGRTLGGADGWRQLNGPVGNPSLWWGARFPGP